MSPWMNEWNTYSNRDQLLRIGLSKCNFCTSNLYVGTPHTVPSSQFRWSHISCARSPNALPMLQISTCCMSSPTNRIQRQPSHHPEQRHGPFDPRTNGCRNKHPAFPHCPTMQYRHGPNLPPLLYLPSTKAWLSAAVPSTMGSWSLPPRSIPLLEMSRQSADCALDIVSKPPSTRHHRQAPQK